MPTAVQMGKWRGCWWEVDDLFTEHVFMGTAGDTGTQEYWSGGNAIV